MSTQLANLQAEIQKEIEAQRQNITPQGGRINTKGKVFTLPDGEVVKNKKGDSILSCIIVDYRFMNTYYKTDWDGQSKNRPDCIATGKAPDDLVPNTDVTDPINHDCASCPMNEWGSATNGRGGKACQNKVRLYLVTPDGDEKAPVFTLDLTPTALGSFNSYMDAANKAGKLPLNFITEISFDENKSFPTCRVKAVEENEAFATHWGVRERIQNQI